MKPRHAFVIAFAVSVGATDLAHAQSAVRVVKDRVDIRLSSEGRGEVLMTATSGQVFEVIYTEGDKFREQKSNWYWIVLPPDAWGTRRTGWLSGHDVRHAQLEKPAPHQSGPDCPCASEPVRRAEAGAGSTPPPPSAPPAVTPDAAVPAAAAVAAVAPEPVSVVVNFAFGRSDLSDQAKSALSAAVANLKAGSVEQITIAVEGHADSTGTEPFNERLGLARAESVKRYLAEQHKVPADKISVASYGESHPAASNDTSEGRAQNRRVVVKVG
jgi:outer membrane protein OmpA-like peptidoglycan-associated protein